jgi:hypothetical protein
LISAKVGRFLCCCLVIAIPHLLALDKAIQEAVVRKDVAATRKPVTGLPTVHSGHRDLTVLGDQRLAETGDDAQLTRSAGPDPFTKLCGSLRQSHSPDSHAMHGSLKDIDYATVMA